MTSREWEDLARPVGAPLTHEDRTWIAESLMRRRGYPDEFWVAPRANPADDPLDRTARGRERV